jgi:hypothetical protein
MTTKEDWISAFAGMTKKKSRNDEKRGAKP